MKDKKATTVVASSIRTFFAKKQTSAVASLAETDTFLRDCDESRDDAILLDDIEVFPIDSNIKVAPSSSSSKVQSFSKPVFSIFSPKVARHECNLDRAEGDENSDNSQYTSSEVVDTVESAQSKEVSHGRPKRQAALAAKAYDIGDDTYENTPAKTVCNKKLKGCPPTVTDLTNSEESATLSEVKPLPNAFFLPAKQNLLKKSSNSHVSISKDTKVGTKKKDISEEEKILLRQKEKEEKEHQMAEKFQLELLQKRMNESQSFAKSGNGVNVFFMQQQNKASSSVARRLISENTDICGDDSESCSLNAPFVDIANCSVLSSYGLPNLQEYISQIEKQYANYPTISYRSLNASVDLTGGSSNDSYNDTYFENACTHMSQVPTCKFDFRVMCNMYMISQKLSQTAQSFSPSTSNNGNNIASWSDIYSPKSKADMIGNSDSIKEISEWLGIWAGKRRAKKRGKKKRTRAFKDLDFEEPDILSNLMIVCGPSGSGTTSVVSACAKEMGYNIIEINASQTRSGSFIKKSIAEATQSNGLGLLASDEGNASAPSNVKALNLILFDEIDIIFDDDTALYSTIQQLVKTSKCPIILTTQSQTMKPTFKAQNPKCITFTLPDSDEVYKKLKPLYSPINNPTCVSTFMDYLSSLCSGDLRSCFNSIQFIAQSGLASSPVDGVSDSKTLSFSEWILDQKYDIAFFDNVSDTLLDPEASELVQRTTHSEASASTETAGIVVPIVFNTSPKKGAVSGGYVVRITGKNFLQRSSNKASDSSLLVVNVFIGGVLCESQVESDSSICAKIPALSEGVHVISVTVGSAEGVKASSETCGSAGGWVNVYNPQRDIRRFFGKSTAKSKKPKSNYGTLTFTAKRTKSVERSVVEQSDDNSAIKVKTGKLSRKRVSTAGNADDDDDDDMLFHDGTGGGTSRKRKNVLTDDDDDEIEEVPKEPDLSPEVADLLNCEIQRIMKSSVDLLLAHRCAEPFALPVDTEVIYDYADKIKEPMDLGTIQESLSLDLYALTEGVLAHDMESFVTDVRRIWSNCRIYNGPSADLTRYANILSDVFEKTLRSSLDILRENIALEIQNISHQSVDVYVRFPADNEIVLANSMSIALIDLYNDSGDDLFDDKEVEDVVEIVTEDDTSAAVETLPEAPAPQALASLLEEAEGRRRKGIRSGFNYVSVGVECLYQDDDTVSAPILHRPRSDASDSAVELQCVEDMSNMYAHYSDSELLASCHDEFSYLERRESVDATANHRYLYSGCIRDASSLLQYGSTQLLKRKVQSKSGDPLYSKLFLSLIDVKLAYTQTMDRFGKLNAPSEEPAASADDADVLPAPRDDKYRNNLSRLEADMDEEEFVSSDDDDSDDGFVDLSPAGHSCDPETSVCDRNSKWHTSCSHIDSPYIRFTIRKNAYVRFVGDVLTNFETGAFDNNNLTNAVCRELALDYIPFVGLILHSDATRCKFDEPSLSGGRSRTRLKSRRGRVKYPYVSELLAGMPDRDLDRFVEFSFVELSRLEVEPPSLPLW